MVDINAAQDLTKMETSKPPFLGPALAGFCGLLIGVGLGRFGYPPLIPAMVEANWGAPAAFHLAGAFNLAGYVVGAIVAVPIISRLGTKQSLWLGAVMATAAFAVSIVPLPAWLFSAARALSGIAGGILMIILPPIIAASVAPEAKGRANGSACAGVGTGFVLSGTALPALAGLGPSAAWMGLTIVMIAASTVLLITAPNVEARPVQSGH
ncbi:MAG: YbfB/YjiJ family MFS transporter, partial [Alphaproteobacteria bacterium]